MKNNKWTTSLNGEIFNGGEYFDTREEAIKYMVDDLDKEDLKKGFWIGQVRDVHLSELISVDTLIEDAMCQAEDVAGEAGEDWLDGMNQKHVDELNTLVIDWFEKKGFQPTFFAIKNTEKITF